jgi:DNA-binding SARP family transcriptional activator
VLELSFLGSPIARLHGQALTLPTRKAWALLAYLACEPGMHAREKLAAMLWPDNNETGGRTALRKALGFLNAALEVDKLEVDKFAALNVSRDALGFNLGADVRSDVLSLEVAAKRARAAKDADASDLHLLEAVVDAVRGEFMAGFLLPEATDFEDWLEVRREGLRRDVDTVLHRLLGLQADAGHVVAALGTARKRVVLDALNEAAHRAVIELHLRNGDRAAALAAFRQCQVVLERELGIVPALETQALAAQARTGQAGSGEQPAQPLPPELNDSDRVINQPAARSSTGASLFVGRQREWDMLEDAWNADLIAFVSGEPGAGKSRLMQEFMREKGVFVSLENRPGDAGVPYASLARHLRALLKSQAVTLEAWVSSELSRILPELGADAPPIQSEQGKLRFLQAIARAFETVIRTNTALTALVYDDAQFTDSSSAEAIGFVLEQLEREDRAQLRILYGYRKNEITPELEAWVKQTLLAGEGVLIELEPLPASALEALLQSLLVNILPEDMAGISRTLEQFTGGNPLFVLETVKSLTESQHGEQWTAIDLETMRSENRLPKSSKVKQVIERRLERLSKPARDLVRVAAVMGQEYTLERAARVLEADRLVLAEASDELEVVGIVRANRFTHDLLFETSYEGIPKAAKVLLHSRVLDALENFVEVPDRARRMTQRGGLESLPSEQTETVLGHPRATHQQVPVLTLLDHAVASGQKRQIFIQSVKAGQSAAAVYNMQLANECFFLAKQTLLESPNILDFSNSQDQKTVSQFFVSYLFNLNRLRDFSNGKKICKEFIQFAKSNQFIELELELMTTATKTNSYQFFDFSEAVQILKDAENLLENHPNHYFSSSVYAKFADIYFIGKSTGDLSARLKLYTQNSQKALDFAEKITDQESKSGYFSQHVSRKNYIAEITANLAYAYYQAGNLNESMRILVKFENLSLSFSDQSLNWSYFFKVQSFTYHSIGELETAKDLSQKAVEIAHDQWSPYAVIWACKPLWNVYLEYGFYEKVIQKHASFLKEEDYSTKISLFQSKADTFLLLGQIDSALHCAMQAHEINESHSSYAVGNFMQSAICAAHLFQGHWGDAADWAQRAQVVREQHFMNEPPRCYYWHLETHALLRTTTISQIRAEMDAREVFVQHEHHHRYQVPHLRSRAVLEHHEGRYQDALSSLTLSLEIATQIGLRTERWQLESDIAHIHDLLCDHEAATGARSRATEIRDLLASWIPDETMRNTYLAFTQKQIDLPLSLPPPSSLLFLARQNSIWLGVLPRIAVRDSLMGHVSAMFQKTIACGSSKP